MSTPAVSVAAALWRQVVSHLREHRPMVATVAEKACADAIDDFSPTLIIRAPHLAAMILERHEIHLDIEILLSDLTNHRVLHLHIIRQPLIQ